MWPIEHKLFSIEDLNAHAWLPRFDPTTGKPLANYLMMDNLVNELLHIKVQYKLDESSFVSMLLSQFSTE